MDRQPDRPVRELQGGRRAGDRLRPGDRRQAGRQCWRSATPGATASRQRRHGQRPRLPLGVLRQGTAAVDAERALGGPRHPQRRACPRRRLRAERSSAPCAPIRSMPSRDFEGFTHRDIVAPTLLVSHAGQTRGFLDDDRLRLVEDRRPDRPRLHAAAAHHARQRTRRICSSRRSSAWLSAKNARRRAVERCHAASGRPALSSSRRTTQQDAVNNFSPFGALAVHALSGHPALAATRRSTTTASASTARAR